MADRQRREVERRLMRESSLENEADVLMQRVRNGSLTLGKLRIASYLGHPIASLALGEVLASELRKVKKKKRVDSRRANIMALEKIRTANIPESHEFFVRYCWNATKRALYVNEIESRASFQSIVLRWIFSNSQSRAHMRADVMRIRSRIDDDHEYQGRVIYYSLGSLMFLFEIMVSQDVHSTNYRVCWDSAATALGEVHICCCEPGCGLRGKCYNKKHDPFLGQLREEIYEWLLGEVDPLYEEYHRMQHSEVRQNIEEVLESE